MSPRKLLLDQGTPRSLAVHLQRAGIDAVHTADIGMATATDPGILEKAREQGRTVVTLDADFHSLLASSDATQPSVIRIRIEGLRAEAFCSLLVEVIARCGADLEKGVLVSVRDNRIRIRRLPLAC